MRILHIVRQFSPAVGGLENFVKSLVLEQREMGLEAEVLTLNRIFHQSNCNLLATEIIDGIPVKRIPYRGSHKYPLAPQVLSFLKPFDLVHVHGVDFFADFLAWTKPLHQKPMVLSTHGGFFHTPYASRFKSFYFNTLTRLSMRSYLRVYACSNNDFQRFEHICSSRLQLIENGVDTSKFANSGSKTHTPTLVFIGRFSENKRIDKLVAMMKHLRKLNPAAKLLIIGKDWDGNLQQLKQQIVQFQLQNSIQILVDLSDIEIKHRLKASSYIVSASEYEGFGLTLIEGMAAGLIPIASPIPSFERIILKAQLGELVNFEVPSVAARSINDYMNSVSPNYEHLRSEAMERSKVYSWSTVAKYFVKSYNQLNQLPRTIQGVNVDGRKGDDVIATLDDSIEKTLPLIMAYANAHTINLARKDSSYQQVLNRALVVNDGVGLAIASRWKYGQRFCENLNGTDFTPRYLEQTRHSLKIFLLGAKPASVSNCFEKWQQRYPDHQWVGFHHGFFTDNDDICSTIRKSGANVLIVAMGNPKQEQWLDSNLGKTGATLGIGVGALFDFTSGEAKRAPNWIRKLRAEWVYRLLQEPKRMWRRYLVGNLTFLFNAMGDKS